MPSLVATTGELAGARFMVQGEAVIGRSPSCEIAVHDSRASRRHCRLTTSAGKLTIVDLGSRNGTLVNGEPVTDVRALEPGDRVIVGGTTFVVDPPLSAELASPDLGTPDETFAAEDLIPVAGAEGVLLNVAGLLFSAESSGAVLRRAGEELIRALGADMVSALILQEGSLVPSVVLGAKEVSVPRPLVRAALDQTSVGRLGAGAAAPLAVRGAAPLGVIFAERRDEPFTREELSLLAAVSRLAALAMNALKAHVEAEEQEEMLIGQSRGFRRALELARKVAFSDLSACFVGERGTGKRALARFSASRGPRALQPVVIVDSRAPGIEEQLLGGRTRISAFARADGGTLLLLGIDGMPRALYARLVDVLGRRMAPGPDGGEIRFDVRLYATARQSPSALAARGEMPFELANLCAGVEVEVPPLRERPGDLPMLLEHFARALARRGPGTRLGFSPEALAALGQHTFPGNVSEVRNLAERLTLLGISEVLPEHLPPETQASSPADGEALSALVERLERDAIARAMARAVGKKVDAARLLGISRPTLDKKLAEYGLGSTRRRVGTPEGMDAVVTHPSLPRPTSGSDSSGET